MKNIYIWILITIIAIALQVHIVGEHFEDGSGRISVTYCLPFNPCY